MRFLALVARNLLHRPIRSLLTISGVATAVAAVVALVGIAQNFERAQVAAFEAGGVDLMVARAGSIQRLSSVLDEGLGEKIRALPDVTEASPELLDVVSFPEQDLFGVLVQGLTPASASSRKLEILDGRPMETDNQAAVMLGHLLAKNLNKKVGDSIDIIEGNPFPVAAVFRSPSVLDNNTIVMPIRQLQRVMGRERAVTQFAVTTERHDRQAVEAVAAKIESLAPALEAYPARDYVDTAMEVRMAKAVAWLTSTIALVICTIGMFNTMATAVFERTRELSILRAIGWRKWTVMKLILSESIVLGLAGAVVGTLVALGLTRLLGQFAASQRLVSGEIGIGTILQGFTLALLLGTLGGLYPAYRAASLAPTEGFRHE